MTATSTPPVPDRLQAIIAELGAEFYERGPHIETLIIGDLAGEHTYLLGPPGVAKSALVRATCARITGARYGEALLDRQLPLEALFGPWDIARYEQTGRFERNVEGFLPTAHKYFLDEAGKAGPATLNPLLAALNERLYHNAGTTIDIPLISCVGASNEELEPELAAIWDRFLLRMLVEPIQEPKHFADLLASAVVHKTTDAPTTITLGELQHAMRVEVPAIKLPTGIVTSLLDLRTELRAEQIEPSDRRWKKSVRLLQASAYLNGRDAVDDDDLLVLENVLWDVAEQIPRVQRTVRSHLSPVIQGISEIEETLDAINKRLRELKGQSTEDLATAGADAQAKINLAEKRIDELTTMATDQGRSTARLGPVRERLRDTLVNVYVECMRTPPDRARRIVDSKA